MFGISSKSITLILFKLSITTVNHASHGYTLHPKPPSFLLSTSTTSTELKMSTTTSKPDPTVASVPKMGQRWRKSTKQIATLGPAASTPEMIEKLFLAGADVFRLNFSHGSQEQKKRITGNYSWHRS
mmetsp:Transcript_53309/g.79203  ORF Transcript_53309/g.79203 Transcript_53309/m.79203 type:complete len:127 (+) Transcript_53309:54-434(+)